MNRIKRTIKTIAHAVYQYNASGAVLNDFLKACFGGKLFETRYLSERAGNHLLAFCAKNYVEFHDNIINYDTRSRYIQAQKRKQYVLFRRDCTATHVFWVKGRPVIITHVGDDAYGRTSDNFIGTWESSTSPTAYCVRYFRGSLDLEAILVPLLEKAADDLADFEQLEGYSITQISSRASKGLIDKSYDCDDKVCVPDDPDDPFSGGLPIGFSYEDFVRNVSTPGLRSLALSNKQKLLIDEINKWMTHKEWFYAHGVPWRRGYMLYGAPGTGKTSFVRGLAMKFKMPIFSFDLSGFTNDELKQQWMNAASSNSGPRIILIEDIDATFNGRKNITKSDLTFDALLNCIDGAQQTDGVLLFITTNHRDKIDAALAHDNDDEIGSRPGRIDRIVHFDVLDNDGKRLIADRILRDENSVQYAIEQSNQPETGAQFQERCIRYACANFWDKECD